MVKKYAKNSSNYMMTPTNETIQFLIDFSKGLRVVKLKTNKLVELSLN